MPSNLPKIELDKIINRFPYQALNTFWYLFLKGKCYLHGNTIYFTLWLVNISNSNYPVKKYNKTIIGIKVLSVKSNLFILNSIYKFNGKLLKYPKTNTEGLSKNKISLNPNKDFKNYGLYNFYNKANYPIPSVFQELKGALFYHKKIITKNSKEIDVIVPLEIINEYFFLSHNSKLNNFIINNTIKDYVNKLGISDLDRYKIGNISQDRSQITRKAALYIGKYFFTEYNSGEKALNLLRSNHMIKFSEGEKKVFLESRIPFAFDCDFEVLGQYIDDSTFLTNRITKFSPKNHNPFLTVEKINTVVLNDNRSTGKYANENEKNYNRLNNDYSKVNENLEYNNSDFTSEIYDIQIQQENDYSFNFTPPNQVTAKDSNKAKYVLDKIIKGQEYQGGTANLADEDKEDGITKTNLEISIYNLLKWNIYAIKALLELCRDNNYSGKFIKLNCQDSDIDYMSYNSEHHNVLSWMPQNSKKNFKFVLFEIFANNKYYYFFEKGAGNYSAVFSHKHHIIIENNTLNLFLKEAIEIHNLNWSKMNHTDIIKTEGIIVHQAIRHPSPEDNSSGDGSKYLINELIKRIKKRL